MPGTKVSRFEVGLSRKEEQIARESRRPMGRRVSDSLVNQTVSPCVPVTTSLLLSDDLTMQGIVGFSTPASAKGRRRVSSPEALPVQSQARFFGTEAARFVEGRCPRKTKPGTCRRRRPSPKATLRQEAWITHPSPLTPHSSPNKDSLRAFASLRLCVEYSSRASHTRCTLNLAKTRDWVRRPCVHPSLLTPNPSLFNQFRSPLRGLHRRSL